MQLTRRFTILNGAALLVGVLAGLAAVGFRSLVHWVESVAFTGNPFPEFEAGVRESPAYIATTWGFLVFLVPGVGGLIVGLLRRYFPGVQRQGVPEVMAAVQARGGIIKGRSAWGHALISAITVGSGGSTGREGPIAYIGAAIGSSLGRRAGFLARDIKVLLGAGAAAGIAATFNAPLGGVLFALEVIVPEFSTHAFIPLVLAVVMGVTVGNLFLGEDPAFLVPAFQFAHPIELVFHLVLGLICGLGGVAFIKLMAKSQDVGERMRLPEVYKPAVGGLMVGAIGLLVWSITSRPQFGSFGQYHVFGTGYATLNSLLSNQAVLLLVPTLILLVIAKPLASSITIGSGGGGGVFSSSLFQGALYGALVGVAVNAIWPDITASPADYALVGMGAFYASAGRATLTTIVLLSEMTNGYDIVLPLMFAAVTADAVSVGLSKDSIYTVRLRKRGIHYDHDRVQHALDSCTVGEVMTTDVDALPGTMEAGVAWGKMMDMGHNGFPVIDDEGKLMGVVTRRDLSNRIHEGKGEQPLSEVISGLTITAFPEDTLHKARDRIFTQDIGRLIVVDPQDRTRILGIITRSDVLRAEAEHDVDTSDTWKQ